jgi:hypothetical protein
MSQTQQDVYVGGNIIKPSPAVQVIQEISEGTVPKNKNVVESLREMEKALATQAEHKKGTESRFAYDAQRFVRHARKIMEEKNNDDTLRQVQEHIKVASDLLAESSLPSAEKLQAHGEAWVNQQSNQLQSMVDSFRRLIIALAKNANVRVRLIEIIQILEESLSDIIGAAAKLEEKIEEKTGTKPSGDAAAKLEEAKGQADKKMTTGQRREKLRKLLVELGTTPEYKEFINNLSTFFQINWQYLSTLLDETTADTKTTTALLVVTSDVQTILERFSGDKSLNTLRNKLGALLITISKDSKIRELFGKWRDFLKKTIESPEKQDLDSMDRELTSILDTGKDLLQRPKIQEDFGVLLKELKGLFERLQEDEAFKIVGNDLDQLRKELLLNNDGKLDLMSLKSTLPTLKNVLIPTITATLRSIPVPSITIDNEKMFLQLSNLSLAAKDLIPEKIRIHFTNDILFDFSTEGKDLFISRLTVLMRDFNATLKDVNFKYDRKKTPQVSDFGVANVEIQGIHIDIRWRMEMNASRLCFYVDYAKCLIDSLKTDIKEANHKMLDNMYLTLFNGSMKRNLETTIEDTLREKMLQFSIDTSAPLSEQMGFLPQA